MSPKVLVSFCCLLSVGSVLVVAQDNAGAAPHVAGILDCAGLHTGQSNSEPVEKPDCSKKAEAPDENVIVAGLGDSIAVQVTDLKEWVEKGPSKSDPHKIIPYLDGRPLTGNYPSVVDLAQNKLVFDLQLSSRSKGSWIAQLSQHKKHKVMFSVGLEDKNAFPS